ncbi:MAG: hypothetical protein IPK37_03040 [Austwickia sp.]|nr:MAG: hypothetical protein IPK37_03040 [Austwickia sp.]
MLSWAWWLPEERRSWMSVTVATGVVVVALAGWARPTGRSGSDLIAHTTRLVVGSWLSTCCCTSC